MAPTDYEVHPQRGAARPASGPGARSQVPGKTGHACPKAGALSALTLVAALSVAPGCNFAVKHPAVTAGIVGGTLGLATCKLASDNIGTCLAVGGGAGAFLGLVAATALWLGGDGHSVLIEEQAQPLPDDGLPRRRRKPPVDPAAPEPGQPAASPSPASPASPSSLNPSSPSPSPTTPGPASPASAGSLNPSPASPSPTTPSPAAPSSPSPTPPPPP